MLHFKQNHKRDEVTTEGADAGGGKENNQETPKEESESKVDNLGYGIENEGDKGKEEGGKENATQESKQELQKQQESSKEETEDPTAYNKESKKPEVEAEKKPEVKVEDESQKSEEIKLDTDTLNDNEIKEINDFVKKHGVKKETAQALVDMKKVEIKQLTDDLAADRVNQIDERDRIRSEWYQELKTDTVFGGEKFAHNVKQAYKVIGEWVPELKKELTDNGGMLKPYVMKGLAKLANHLYSAEKLTQGDPAKLVEVNEKKDNNNDYLDFYNS